jgi:adenylate cyclase
MRLRFRRQLLLVVGLAAAVLAVGGYELGVFERVELATLDSRFGVRGERPEPRLVTVDIDERTRVAYPDQRYPFPRRFDAKVIDALRRDGARLIAYDVEFTEATTEADDVALLDAAFRARPTVFAASKVDDRGKTRVFGGANVQRQVDAAVGSVNFRLDPGGVYRHVEYSIEGLKSFAVVAAEVAEKRTLRATDIGGRRALIDFAGPPGTIESVSYVDVINGRFPRGTFRDKIVVVGAADPALQDVHATSTSGGELMPGPEIQANAISTILRGAPLRPTGAPLNQLVIAVLALLIPLATLRIGPLRAQAIALAAGAGYAVTAQVAFNAGHVLPVAFPLGGLAMGSMGAIAVHYLLAALDRKRAHETFARFVPEPIVERLLALTGDDLRLGGSRVTATVMFTDIRGFTSFSETRDPEEVIDVLNQYLEGMTEAILDHGGTLVNYIGDGIMAIWGAPLEQDDHADRALASAKEMLDVRLPAVNKWMHEQGDGHSFRIGVGLHSGPLVAGNVGSMRHLQYTAIGDTCNTASRIEGLTKQAGYQLLMSAATYELLEAVPEDLTFIDAVEIRGRVDKVQLYGLAPYEA